MKLKLVITLVLLGCSQLTYGANYWVHGKITKTLVDSGNYGGCMIAMEPTDMGQNCGSTWVSLDCDGTFYTVKSGEQKFASALLALSSQKDVSLYIDDSKKTGSYCVVRRIDVSR